MTGMDRSDAGRQEGEVREHSGSWDGRDVRIGIVAARFNDAIVERLVDGARGALTRVGVADRDVELAWVPGAFEVPLVAQRLAASGRVDAVVCLGAVIRGATPHFDLVAGQCAAGVARVAHDTGVPTTLGVLTTDTIDQAVERAGTKAGNKGADAALAAVELVTLLRELDGDGPARSPAGCDRAEVSA
jgi:6,7-dimethyl-8-ribityllumazine synthase